MRFIRLLAILGVCGTGPGCGLVGTGTSTLANETKLALIHHQLLSRARRQADAAWVQVNSRARTPFSKDYERGFKDGFVRTVWWGPEEAPVVPPSGYWSARFRGPEGEAAVADWAEGFRNGVSVALQNGASLSVKLHATDAGPDTAAAPGPDQWSAPPPPARDARDTMPGKDTEVLPPPRPVSPAPPPGGGAGAAKAPAPGFQDATRWSRPPRTMTAPQVQVSPTAPLPGTPRSTWTAVPPESAEEARPAGGTPPILPCAAMEVLQTPPVARLGRPW